MSNEKDCGSGCGSCSSNTADNLDEFLAEANRENALRRIKHKLVVLSGKGGVGKSTVAVNMAVSLALKGKRVGLLDVDVHGPSVPKLLKLENARIETAPDGKILPVGYETLKVMSLAFLLRDRDDAVIWRGPMKAGAIKQLVEEVAWGDLDYLVVDCPPGTGDEPLSVIQTLNKVDGAVIVTTPQDLAIADVRKSITFCKQLETPVTGIIENMSGFVCPKCGEVVDVFKTGGGEQMASDMKVDFLGKVPLEPNMVQAGDAGTPYVYSYGKSETAKTFEEIVDKIIDKTESESVATVGGNALMKIAIPMAEKRLSMHFGHCEEFAIMDVDKETKSIESIDYKTPPAHEPGILPKWIGEQGVELVIAGGMGTRARDLFEESGVHVICGAPSMAPQEVVTQYLAGTLETGDNVCDH